MGYKDFIVNSYLDVEPSSQQKLSIGMPVYNGESHIRQALDSLLSQTFTNFELIISDNASTDLTSEICQEYARKDRRILYVRQPRNMGAFPNFYFVLQNANSKYFMWAAVDDAWEPTFIEKNIAILETNKNVVGSISEVDKLDPNSLQSGYNAYPLHNFTKHRFVCPFSGKYEKKASFCLKFHQATAIYAIYRTKELKKSFPIENPLDIVIILSVLRYGDIHVIDEILMHRSGVGTSSRNVIKALRQENISYRGILFMYLPFLKWCKRELGLKFIIKNLPFLAYIHCIGYGRISLDLLRWIKVKIQTE